MILLINMTVLVINIYLHWLLLPELKSLVSINVILSKLMNKNIPCILTYLSVIFLLYLLPLVSIVIILSTAKLSFHLGHKCIIKSFTAIFILFLTSINIRQFKTIYMFLVRLGLSESYYYTIRCSMVIDQMVAYFPLYDFLIGTVVHVLTFVIVLAFIECTIARKQSVFSFIRFFGFIYRGKALIISILTIIGIYCTILYISNEKWISQWGYSDSNDMLSYYCSSLYEGFVTNGIVLYFYLCFGLDGSL